VLRFVAQLPTPDDDPLYAQALSRLPFSVCDPEPLQLMKRLECYPAAPPGSFLARPSIVVPSERFVILILSPVARLFASGGRRIGPVVPCTTAIDRGSAQLGGCVGPLRYWLTSKACTFSAAVVILLPQLDSRSLALVIAPLSPSRPVLINVAALSQSPLPSSKAE
jgi:hypothetical protein